MDESSHVIESLLRYFTMTYGCGHWACKCECCLQLDIDLALFGPFETTYAEPRHLGFRYLKGQQMIPLMYHEYTELIA